MHELSIVMSIIEIAEENAKKENASVIHEIELDIGQQSGVVREALDFAIESAKTGTLLENARWVIHEIAILAKCTSCGHEYNPVDIFTPCPACGNPFSHILRGRELRIKSLKIE